MTAKLAVKPTSKGIKGMMKEGSLFETRAWRGGQTLGLFAIMWMVNQNFASKEKFEDYKLSHQQWSEAKLNNIDEKLDQLRHGQELINAEIRAMSRKTRDALLALPQSER